MILRIIIINIMSNNYRSKLILSIFNSDNISNNTDAIIYIKSKDLDKVHILLTNKNIDDLISGINLFYINDYKEKKLYDLYDLMVLDFCKNNETICWENTIVINKLIKKVSLLDKGYQLLHIIHQKYDLTNYASSILDHVLKKGTLTNLLFWKKIMVDKYIFTINNLILVVKNTDIRLLKYFVNNVYNIQKFNSNINNIVVSKILTSLMFASYIPVKFKLKRLKILNKVIDFNNYLDIMFNKLPLYIINNIYKYYNFDKYMLNINDIENLQESKSLINFYNLTNNENKNTISLLYLFKGYNLNNNNDIHNAIHNNINNIIKNKINMRQQIVEMFCMYSHNNKLFYNKNNYILMTNIMRSQFNGVNYIVNLKYWDYILDYVYYILPFIKNIKLHMKIENNICKVEKSYNILKRFFNNIYYKRVKYNRMMKLLKTEECLINNNDNAMHNAMYNNIITDKSKLDTFKYYCYYYEGIITNNIPPNISPIIQNTNNINNIKCIYLEDESLYLIITDNLELIYQHEYLVKNNIILDSYNYNKILQDFIKDNKYTSNIWFPLIIFENNPNNNNNPLDINAMHNPMDINAMHINNQFIGLNKVEDLYNNKYTIIKNRENIYIKLKIIISNNSLKIVDYENNNYIFIKDKIEKTENIDNSFDNNIIKYYPYRNINDICSYEIYYYSFKPNKKDKIDYLLNL